MAGVLTETKVIGLVDSMTPGGTFLGAAEAAGYGDGKSLKEVLAAVRVPEGTYDAFVELHIEQGDLTVPCPPGSASPLSMAPDTMLLHRS